MHSNLSTDELASQVQVLIQDAPSDDQTKQLVEIVANTLALFATKHLSASHYYLIQDATGAWLKNTLIHRTQSTVEKTTIFIFFTLEDASKEIVRLQNPQLSPQKIPVIDLLFRFWTLNLSDSLVFEDSSNANYGTTSREITRSQLSTVLKAAQSQARSGEKARSSGQGFGKKSDQGLRDIC
jgi:hypothetical protein